MGVAVKDVEIGLCDFLGKMGTQDVWLCWQYGEKEVAWWHTLDSGFAGRKPISPDRPSPRLVH